jgi:hypothetical protein
MGSLAVLTVCFFLLFFVCLLICLFDIIFSSTRGYRRLGVMQNALSQMRGVTTRAGFACALVRGVGGSLLYPKRVELAKTVFGWVKESPPDESRVLDCYADERGRLALCVVSPSKNRLFCS